MKIKLLFIQEKIVHKANALTLGDLIEKQAPDTYEMDRVSAKEDILGKVKEFGPQIVMISDCKSYDVFDLIKKIKELDSKIVILVSVLADAGEEHERMERLKEIGVYKCYTSRLSVDSLIHDMFVSLNLE